MIQLTSQRRVRKLTRRKIAVTASQYIPANSSKTYWCSGYETIQGFRGAWSVDCKLGQKNYVSRYTLSR